jgi:hypothetical protein
MQDKNTTIPLEYEAFHPKMNAKLALEFLFKLTDAECGYLPYGLVAPMHETPYAEHGRADDAELVASWFEAVSCLREILSMDCGVEVEDGLRAHLLDEGWDERSGLRFPVRRPWSRGAADYALISEMADVLSALNRIVEINGAGNAAAGRAAECRAQGLVRGLRRLATSQRARLLGFGPAPLGYPCLSFASDAFVLGSDGLDPACATGYADSVMRCSTLIEPLVRRHALAGDDDALELATGLANRIVMLSRFFSARTEFSGSTCAALRTAAGLIGLGKASGNEKYTQTGKGVYDFVRRGVSAFGWVPSHSNWQLPAEERCDGASVSWMMRCAAALTDSGFNEYFDDTHRFWRNHLEESQLTDTSFLPAPDARPADDERRTYRDIAARILGGVSGCTAVNNMQFSKYAAVSPHCTAAAAQAMAMMWQRVAAQSGACGLQVCFPVNYEDASVKVTVGYPNSGTIRAELKVGAQVSFRLYPWMGPFFEGRINDRPAPFDRRDEFITFEPLPAGSSVMISHELKTRRVMENVMGMDFFGVWRGPDMIDVLPHSFHVRLYQRVKGQPKELPDGFGQNRSAADLGPAAEPITAKEKKIVRRKPPKN